MPGSARRPRDSQVGTVRDPAHQLLLGQLRRQALRTGGEMERLRAAIAIIEQEMARMRGEWSPDDPSEWDGMEDGKHLEVIGEPAPSAREAQAKEPPFRHYDTPFGQPKPSRPKFTDDDPRPEMHPQFHQVKFVAPERETRQSNLIQENRAEPPKLLGPARESRATPRTPERRLPAGFVLLEMPHPSSSNSGSACRIDAIADSGWHIGCSENTASARGRHDTVVPRSDPPGVPRRDGRYPARE